MFDAEIYDVDLDGSNIVEELEPDDNTFVLSSNMHLSGFWATDIQAQLTKRNIDILVLAGMFVNLCVESHLRNTVENGFEVPVVEDAPAAPDEKFLEAARTNCEMIGYETAEADEIKTRLADASIYRGDRRRGRLGSRACSPADPTTSIRFGVAGVVQS